MSSIVTFYSFKGGVGRTMALANIATILTRRGQRVLMVDWDLEAPGLERYFSSYGLPAPSESIGLLDLFEGVVRGERPSWRDAVVPVALDRASPPTPRAAASGGTLELLPCGRQDDDYPARVVAFDWDAFFARHDGGAYIEHLREEWKRDYDIVLVDSRTGFSDSGGVCTILLPDILTLVFTATEQSLEGIVDVARRAQRARQDVVYDRMQLLFYPLLSRFDHRAEFEEAQRWIQRSAERLAPLYDAWLPRPHTPRDALEHTKLPHVPYFSFGEKLPAESHGTSDPDSLGHYYAISASLLASDLRHAKELLSPRDDAPARWDVYIAGGHETDGGLRALVEALREAGLTVFFEPDSVRVGDDIFTTSMAALEVSAVSLFYRYFDDGSRLCNAELPQALAQAQSGRHLIIPVHGPGDPTPAPLERIKAIGLGTLDNLPRAVSIVADAVGRVRRRDRRSELDAAPPPDAHTKTIPT